MPLLHHYKVGKKYEKLIVIICCLSGLIGLILTFYNNSGYDLKNEIYAKKNTIKKFISSFKEYIINKTYRPIDNVALNQEVKSKDNNKFLYTNKDSKMPFFMDFQNNENEENYNNNNMIRNYSFFRFALCLILISLNLGLGVSGYILYKQGGKAEQKEVTRIKKFRQKKH